MVSLWLGLVNSVDLHVTHQNIPFLFNFQVSWRIRTCRMEPPYAIGIVPVCVSGPALEVMLCPVYELVRRESLSDAAGCQKKKPRQQV